MDRLGREKVERNEVYQIGNAKSRGEQCLVAQIGLLLFEKVHNFGPRKLI